MSLTSYKLILTFFNSTDCIGVINSTIIDTIYYECDYEDDDDDCYDCNNYAKQQNIILNVCQKGKIWICDVDNTDTNEIITIFGSIIFVCFFCFFFCCFALIYKHYNK